MFEERLFQQEHAVGPLDFLQSAFQRRDGALEIDGAGMSGPAGRHRIASADDAAVVSEVERVVIALPADFERGAQRLSRLLATARKRFVALGSRYRGGGAQHVEEEEAHPDAGAAAIAAEAVDA